MEGKTKCRRGKIRGKPTGLKRLKIKNHDSEEWERDSYSSVSNNSDLNEFTYNNSHNLLLEMNINENKQMNCKTLSHQIYQNRIKYGQLIENKLVNPNQIYVPFLNSNHLFQQSNDDSFPKNSQNQNHSILQPSFHHQSQNEENKSNVQNSHSAKSDNSSIPQNQNTSQSQNIELSQDINQANPVNVKHKNRKVEDMNMIEFEEERIKIASAIMMKEVNKIDQLINKKHQELIETINRIKEVLQSRKKQEQ